jgi:DnaJ-class molecular chaperone
MNRYFKNPYEVLGIQPGASETEVKKAYRDLVKKAHPDKGGTGEQFKEINEAYTQIMKGENPMEEFPELNEIFNLFVNLSGLNSMRSMNVGMIKGPTIRTKLDLTLEELEIGGKYTVVYKRNIPTGNFLNSASHTPFGVINVVVPEESEKIFEVDVEIPRCHDQRKSLIFPRMARADPLPPGDLEVIVSISKHSMFNRVNGTLDLQTELDISLKEALVGFDREIKLLNSEESVKIECRSVVNPYDIKRVKSYGMKLNEDIYGDLLIKFRIQFPVLLSVESINTINGLVDLDHI